MHHHIISVQPGLGPSCRSSARHQYLNMSVVPILASKSNDDTPSVGKARRGSLLLWALVALGLLLLACGNGDESIGQDSPPAAPEDGAANSLEDVAPVEVDYQPEPYFGELIPRMDPLRLQGANARFTPDSGSSSPGSNPARVGRCHPSPSSPLLPGRSHGRRRHSRR